MKTKIVINGLSCPTIWYIRAAVVTSFIVLIVNCYFFMRNSNAGLSFHDFIHFLIFALCIKTILRVSDQALKAHLYSRVESMTIGEFKKQYLALTKSDYSSTPYLIKKNMETLIEDLVPNLEVDLSFNDTYVPKIKTSRNLVESGPFVNFAEIKKQRVVDAFFETEKYDDFLFASFKKAA